MVSAILFLSGLKQKIAISVLAVVALLASVAFLPGYIKARFVTIFQQNVGVVDAQTRARLNADIDSSQDRQALLRQSIQMTFEHPIFGVGPGVFREIAWDERKAKQQQAGQMLVSHNTYTQISSELGFPGFFCFMAAFMASVAYSFSDFRRLKRTDVLLSRASLYTFSSLVGLGFGIFFLSIGYSFLLTAMFGLAASLRIVHSTAALAVAQEGQTPTARQFAPSVIRTPEVVLAERRRVQPVAAARGDRNRPEPNHRVRFGRYVDRG
jgi:O-antigen ligase